MVFDFLGIGGIIFSIMDWKFIVSIILAVVFFIATIVLAIRLNKKKLPTWGHTTNKIIGLGTKTPPELKLTYKDKQVTDVYRTLFIFINRGNEPIRSNDVTSRVNVNLSKSFILREPIIRAVSNKENDFSIKYSNSDTESNVELDFNYIDHNDGVVIEILHTGFEKILCTANIIGSKQLYKIKAFDPYKQDTSRTRIVVTVMAFLGPIAFLVLPFLRQPISYLNIAIYSALFIFVEIYMYRIIRRYYSFLELPKWSRL